MEPAMPHADPAALLVRLGVEPPLEPRGLFRWLHFHYGFRYPGEDRVALKILRDQGVAELAEGFAVCRDQDPEATFAAAERHAWGLGYLGGPALGAELWPQLTAPARGKFLAGASERAVTDEAKAWILTHVSDVQLDPESAAQLACNAVRGRQPELLQAVMAARSVDWNARVARAGWASIETEPDWAEEVEGLSERACDLVLEAALQINDEAAAMAALARGADADLSIWRLERSFNERHCALGYCLSEGHMGLARLLVDRGASARGTAYGGLDSPLHRSLRDPEMVDLLRQHGAVFPTQSDEAVAQKAASQRFICGLDEGEAAWIEREIRPLLPLVGFDAKAIFHNPNAQGGYWESDLKVLIYDDRADLIRRYEPYGLDVRLSAEELVTAIRWKAQESLAFLLGRHGEETKHRVFTCIRTHQPDFDQAKRRQD
jgi:hypothetical protein